MYLSGRSFELETDHKPLERIYSRTSKTCARNERWVLRLQGYDFQVVYRPGKTNIADALFRLNSVKQLDCGEEYDFIRAVIESRGPLALSPKEIEEASYSDEELYLVKNCVRSGNWEQCTIPSYAHVKDKLCTSAELLLRGTRIVVPKVLPRSTPQATTGATPFYLMFSREMRTKVPELSREAVEVPREVRDRDRSNKLKPMPMQVEVQRPSSYGLATLCY